MEKHEIDHQAKWLHIKYDGEDRDDECVNELSIYQNADESELQMLVLTCTLKVGTCMFLL